MSVGFGQIIVIILLLVLLFGDLPGLVRRLVKGIRALSLPFQEEKPKEIEEGGDSTKEEPSKKKNL